jgi:hypothetical protein
MAIFVGGAYDGLDLLIDFEVASVSGEQKSEPKGADRVTGDFPRPRCFIVKFKDRIDENRRRLNSVRRLSPPPADSLLHMSGVEE